MHQLVVHLCFGDFACGDFLGRAFFRLNGRPGLGVRTRTRHGLVTRNRLKALPLGFITLALRRRFFLGHPPRFFFCLQSGSKFGSGLGGGFALCIDHAPGGLLDFRLFGGHFFQAGVHFGAQARFLFGQHAHGILLRRLPRFGINARQ